MDETGEFALPTPTPEERLRHVIAVSITSASANGRTVEDPEKAAMYATNGIVWHNPRLLAEVAMTYARDAVLALVEADHSARNEQDRG